MPIRRSATDIDLEVAYIRSQIDSLKRRDADFQRIIDDMHQLQDSLRSDISVAELKARNLEAEKIPINWLPAELLTYVFMLYAESHWNPSETDQCCHRAPVTLSHVNHRWREITLKNSSLWSRISWGASSTLEPLDVFLARSGTSPLELVYKSQNTKIMEEQDEVEILFLEISDHLPRLRSMTCECHGGDAMEKIVAVINHGIAGLEHVDLSIISDQPIASVSSLMRYNKSLAATKEYIATTGFINKESKLKSLRLDRVPLFNIPLSSLYNLRTLDLCFHPTISTSASPHRLPYFLRMSALWEFLSLTPQLQRLSLIDSAPVFDVTLSSDQRSSNANNRNEDLSGILTEWRRPALVLPKLEVLEWSYPLPVDARRMLSLLVLPSLIELNLSMPEMQSEVDPAASSPCFPTLTNLTIHCRDRNALGAVIRRFSLPALVKLEIANIDPRPHNGHELAVLPRLESIFRDPRLPNLTHLTLATFHISPEHAQAMLGYMPILVSLSLDMCSGVKTLLTDLADVVSSLQLSGLQRSWTVRACPRLKFLHLWSCLDVTFEDIVAVVRARNSYDPDQKLTAVEVGREAQAAAVQDSAEGGQRKIKPLRKPRRAGEIERDSSGTHQPNGRTNFHMDLTSQPSRITHIRIEECPLISEQAALSLRGLWVEEVLWKE